MTTKRKMIIKCELSQDDLHKLVSKEAEERAFMAGRSMTGRTLVTEIVWHIIKDPNVGGVAGGCRFAAIAEVFDEQTEKV